MRDKRGDRLRHIQYIPNGKRTSENLPAKGISSVRQRMRLGNINIARYRKNINFCFMLGRNSHCHMVVTRTPREIYWRCKGNTFSVHTKCQAKKVEERVQAPEHAIQPDTHDTMKAIPNTPSLWQRQTHFPDNAQYPTHTCNSLNWTCTAIIQHHGSAFLGRGSQFHGASKVVLGPVVLVGSLV